MQQGMALIMAATMLSATAVYSKEATVVETDCKLGFASICLAKTTPPKSGSTPFRVESFGGFKPSMSYYEKEQKNCNTEDCSFSATGEIYGFDVYTNIKGHNRSETYTDLGFQYLSIPVGRWQSNSGFLGTDARKIPEGTGSLRYHFLRVNLKRGHFLYLLRSKYLISSFGVGLAIPEAQGTGTEIVGANRVLPSIGGKLGFQYPITPNLDVGLASGWSVLWYGSGVDKAAFISGYGLNISWRV